MLSHSRIVTVTHGFLQQREFHLHCRHACTGDTRHDLLFKAKRLIALVVRHIDGVFTAFCVASLVFLHCVVQDRAHLFGHGAP